MGDTYVPLGTWFKDGWWKPNPNLDMSAKKQYLYNLKHGIECRVTPEQLSEYSDTSPWISVEDRLPEKYRDVLVFNGVTTMAVASFNGFDWDYDWPIMPTHWMPLPDPPEVK